MPARGRPSRPKYVMISVVAERYGIHPQTLRLYDEEAIHRLEIILALTRDLGVNLAGVEVILNMKAHMEQMQGEVDRLLDYVRREAAERRQAMERQGALVKVQGGPLSKRYS